MGELVNLNARRHANLSQQPTCRWSDLHEMRGQIRVASHGGLQVLVFVQDETGRTFVIGEKCDG